MDKVENARAWLNLVFNDSSQTIEARIEHLQDLQSELDSLLNALEVEQLHQAADREGLHQ